MKKQQSLFNPIGWWAYYPDNGTAKESLSGKFHKIIEWDKNGRDIRVDCRCPHTSGYWHTSGIGEDCINYAKHHGIEVIHCVIGKTKAEILARLI